MMVLSLGCWEAPELGYEGGYLLCCGLEESFALGGGRLAGVALDTGFGERRPPRHDLQRPIRPVHPGVIGLGVAMLVDRLRHIYGFGTQVQVQGGLQLTGVRHPATA